MNNDNDLRMWAKCVNHNVGAVAGSRHYTLCARKKPTSDNPQPTQPTTHKQKQTKQTKHKDTNTNTNTTKEENGQPDCR